MPSQRRQTRFEAADNDWLQKEDLDERRRVQNRLSQRKRRSQLKTVNDAGHGQKFMFLEPNTVTLSKNKAPRRHTTTTRAVTPPKGTSSRDSEPTTTTVQMEQPAEWDTEKLSGFDAHVMDFGNMLWDVDIYDNAPGIRLGSPSDTLVPHGKPALLDASGSDIVLDATTEALVSAPLVQASVDCRTQNPAMWYQGTVVQEPGDPVSGLRPTHTLSAPLTDICLGNSMGNFAGPPGNNQTARGERTTGRSAQRQPSHCIELGLERGPHRSNAILARARRFCRWFEWKWFNRLASSG
ncbi:hypothetical protein CC86DRAFT_460161 [Ophiobolus disseminans]|uniref:BZIP domain-containing protein n=1 Tax=Ophiobolus disseminans TaxID=1469910 RepID=A0A6A6ZFE3_9PLEO|nr:hypothetical protein CC86DRAFT_460161 [Ophiobolus disseminans]